MKWAILLTFAVKSLSSSIMTDILSGQITHKAKSFSLVTDKGFQKLDAASPHVHVMQEALLILITNHHLLHSFPFPVVLIVFFFQSCYEPFIVFSITYCI